MSPRPLAVTAALACACESFDLPPIELDVSSNCNFVEVVGVVPGVQSPARAWDTVVTAAVDRPGSAAAWLLVIRTLDGGTDQLALIHVDDALQTDQDVVIDAPAGLASQFELVAGPTIASVYLTQRAPGTFFVRLYDAAVPTPLQKSSPNLAVIAAPCDLDGDGFNESCDASDWYQALVFFERQPFALTFPPSRPTFSVEVTPTPLDDFLSPSFPLDPERTLSFIPFCDDELPEEDYALCQALYSERTYPRLELVGLQRDVRQGLTALAMYREVRYGDDPTTVADVPLFLFGTVDQQPRAVLQVDPAFPVPRDGGPHGVALDANASYLHYTAGDGEAVLIRAPHTSFALDRLDEAFEFPDGAELLQLDEDLALHRIVDGQWQILKLFPDAPARSQLTVFATEAAIERIDPAGPGTFLVRRDDGLADLAHVRCAVPMPE